MRNLRIVVFVLVFLALGGQLFRHVYVRWMEKHTSILDQFADETETEIRDAKSIDDLRAMYAKLKPEVERLRKERERRLESSEPADRAALESDLQVEGRLQKVEVAIRSWEEKAAELRELHYFWGCGALAIVLALLAQRFGSPWTALTLVIGGLLEMEYATCPAFFAHAGEFTRLLDHKILFSLISLVILMLLFFWGPLRPAPVESGR